MSLFVRKDLQALLAEAGSGTLRRELGPVALVTLGIGAVIGAGIRPFIWLGLDSRSISSMDDLERRPCGVSR